MRCTACGAGTVDPVVLAFRAGERIVTGWSYLAVESMAREALLDGLEPDFMEVVIEDVCNRCGNRTEKFRRVVRRE